jgi:hypothetical protein
MGTHEKKNHVLSGFPFWKRQVRHGLFSGFKSTNGPISDLDGYIYINIVLSTEADARLFRLRGAELLSRSPHSGQGPLGKEVR